MCNAISYNREVGTLTRLGLAVIIMKHNVGVVIICNGYRGTEGGQRALVTAGMGLCTTVQWAQASKSRSRAGH